MSWWLKILSYFSIATKHEDLSYLKPKYNEILRRLHTTHLERGWVVSRNTSGGYEHEGDSLLWTGIVVGCGGNAVGGVCLDTLRDCVLANRGALYRFEPSLLSESYLNREISFDGFAGVLFGLALRLKLYPQDAEKIRFVWKTYRDYCEGHGGVLHPNTGVFVPVFFEYAVALMDFKMGMGQMPRPSAKRIHEAACSAWVSLTNLSRKSAYRVHLAFLMLIVCDILGDPVSRHGWEAFKMASAGMDIPMLDWWLGRRTAASWLDTFEYNQWEYRHQRGGYEEPDGDGLETHGVDFLVMYILATELR